jgi:hypothetical protein
MKTPALFKLLLLLPVVLAGSAGGVARGGDFLPAVAGLAAKHREETAKLLTAAETAVGFARNDYVVTLNAAEKEATDKKNGEAITAIDAERRVLKIDALAPDPSTALPRQVIPARREYEKALEKAWIEFSREAKKLNAGYVAALDKIPGKAEDPKLAEQIMEEKQRMLFAATGPIDNVQTGIVGTRWRSTEKPDEPFYYTFGKDGMVNGKYKYETPKKDQVVIRWNNNNGSNTLNLARNGRVLMKNGKPDWVMVIGEGK